MVEKNIVHPKISMVDLETALSYMLRREIPRIKEIQGATYDALLHWMHVLTKVFCYSHLSFLKIAECVTQFDSSHDNQAEMSIARSCFTIPLTAYDVLYNGRWEGRQVQFFTPILQHFFQSVFYKNLPLS